MQEDTYQTLLNAAFRFLSFRPRSSKEIQDFLYKKTRTMYVAPEVVTRIVDRLTELGYIDDVKFAAWWMEARQKTKPRGLRLIKAELGKKGIGPDIIDQILRRSQSGDDCQNIDYLSEEELARRAIQKKREIWKRLSELEQKKKMYDFLTRRGFSYETTRQVIDSMKGNGYTHDEVE